MRPLLIGLLVSVALTVLLWQFGLWGFFLLLPFVFPWWRPRRCPSCGGGVGRTDAFCRACGGSLR